MEAVAGPAAIGGLISLALQSVQISIQGLRLLSTAQQFSNIADLQRSSVAFERQRLLRWYETVDLTKSSLQNSLSPLDWTLIQDVALQLERLLSDAASLEKRYNLEVQGDALANIGKEVDYPLLSRNMLDRLISKFRPAKPFSQTAQAIGDAANPVLRFRYAITGKTKLNELVADIEKLVSKLWQCVGETQQTVMSEGMRYLLREALARASAKEDIETLQELLNAKYQSEESREDKSLCKLPTLKQKRLALRLDVTSQENSQDQASTNQQNIVIPAPLRVKEPEVTTVKKMSYTRDIAKHKSQLVLVEWKRITPGLEDKLEWRVKALGVLLTQAMPETLGSLPCKGIMKDIGKNRYGFVFTLPAQTVTELQDPVRSLFDMLNGQPPSFEERMHIALQLTRSVRQLHTIGWLHKALRSENVIFCPSAKKIEEKGPYLAGFEYARAADPTQFSEIPPAAPESDIYCHPDLLGAQTKVFRKKYDIFSLGALLLEVGLWIRLSSVLLSAAGFPETALEQLHTTIPQRMSTLNADGEGSILQELRSKCPSAFCEAVSICINGQYANNDDEEDSLELQQRVVKLLENLVAIN